MAFYTIPTVPVNGGTFSNINASTFAYTPISQSKGLMVFMQTNPKAMFAQVINYSGNSEPTLGTATLINNAVIGDLPGIRVSMLSTTKAFISFRIADSSAHADVHGQIIDIDINDDISFGVVSSALFGAHQEYGFNAVSNNKVVYATMHGSFGASQRSFTTYSITVTGTTINTPLVVETENQATSVDGFSVLPINDGSGSYIVYKLNAARMFNSSDVFVRSISGINSGFPYALMMTTNTAIAFGDDGVYHTINTSNNSTGIDTTFSNVTDDPVNLLKINNETVLIVTPDAATSIINARQPKAYVIRNISNGTVITNPNNPISLSQYITLRSQLPSQHSQLHLIDDNNIAHIAITSPSGSGGDFIIGINIYNQM